MVMNIAAVSTSTTSEESPTVGGMPVGGSAHCGGRIPRPAFPSRRLEMRPSLAALLVAAFSAVGAMPALAQDDAGVKLRTCAAVSGDINRLGCYDKAFGTAAPVAPVTPAAPVTPQAAAPKPNAPGDQAYSIPDDQKGWVHREDVSGLDGSKTETAMLPSTTAKVGRLSNISLPQHAVLVIRCREGKTDFYVGYTELVDGMDHTLPVEYRIDDNPPQHARWGISQDYQSYGTWQTPETIPFVKTLMHAHEFFVRAKAGAMGSSEASFELAGMEAAIAPVRAACHW